MAHPSPHSAYLMSARGLATTLLVLSLGGCSNPALRRAESDLRVSEAAITFGGAGVGWSRTHVLWLANAGVGPVRLELSPSSPVFETAESAFVLTGGERRAVEVKFSPTRAESFAGELMIRADGPPYQVSVQLDGWGVDPNSCESSLTCHRATFDPENLSCGLEPVTSGTPCDMVCLERATCHLGQCHGTYLDCDDGVHCTLDFCDSSGGCEHLPLSDVCESGEPSCLVQSCDESATCTSVRKPDGAWCRAGNCTQDYVCREGACVAQPRDDAAHRCDAACTRGCAIQQLCVGLTSLCALVDGEVWCRGQNDFGQLGNGLLGSASEEWVRALVPEQVTSFSCTGTNSCALGESGKVYCWGLNGDLDIKNPEPYVWNRVGFLGVGNDEDLYIRHPQVVVGLPRAKQVTSTAIGGCAVAADDGSVWCWGGNPVALCGSDPLDRSKKDVCPAAKVPVGAASMVATAYNMAACVLGVTGEELTCWGRTAWRSYSAGPTKFALPANVHSIKAQGANSYTWQVQLSSGEWAWLTQMTDPTIHTAGDLAGMRMADLHDHASLRACAVDEAGVVWCMGRPSHGELGPLPRQSDEEIVPVPLDARAEQVVFGRQPWLACATTVAGEVICWGAIGIPTGPLNSTPHYQTVFPPTSMGFPGR